jgi:hypothetical protein
MGRSKVITVAFAGAIVIAACSGSDSNTAPKSESSTSPAGTDTPDTVPTTDVVDTVPPPAETSTTRPVPPTTEPPPTPVDTETLAVIEGAIAEAPAGCDPLDTRQCLLPFPSDALTANDPGSPSGFRVAFPIDGMPVNTDGIVVDPTDWNRNDGFSPNASILTYVADLRPEASNLPSWTDLEGSLQNQAAVVLVDTTTGERIPLWAEPDVKAENMTDRLLVIHPAISLAPGTTYAVGLQGLVTTTGDPVIPSATFRAFRDNLLTDIPTIEDRRDDMQLVFEALGDGGVTRADLQLAWSFTTATTEGVTGRMITMRDETLSGLAGSTPEFSITSVDETDDGGIARLVEGAYSVPNWLTGDGSPGNKMNYNEAGEPELNGVVQSPFACIVPDAVLEGTGPANMVMYGHGLLGSHLEIDAGNVVAMANEHNAIYCATKWAGMSEDDIPNAISSLQDLSNFATMADRLQQGVLNQLVLGRLMLAENGLKMQPEFRRADDSPMINNSALYYDGNSQGGIMGMMVAAVSQDFDRAVLGVVGMNYSLLLPRSVDFDTYEAVFIPAYENPLERELLVSVIQMLWDSGEGAGYVRHVVSDPLPNTQEKDVLMHVAFGDWQVTELSAMIAARTMGVPIHRPVTADGRSLELRPGWGIDSLDYAVDTSALVIWDSGSDPIPLEQIAPRTSRDPHSDPRNDVDVRRQKGAFLFDGELIDICNDEPCMAHQR